MEWKLLQKKMKAMRISWHISPIQIMIDKKQLENVEYLNYLGSMISNNARCTCESKSGLPWQKQHSARRRLSSPANWTYI
jgi:hypothetical protein